MASYQAYHTDKLARVSGEGFAIIDEFYGRNNKSAGRFIPSPQAYDHHQIHHQHYYSYNYQRRHVYGGPQVITVIREPVIDSNQAAQLYGGMAVVDYSVRKPIPKAY